MQVWVRFGMLGDGQTPPDTWDFCASVRIYQVLLGLIIILEICNGLSAFVRIYWDLFVVSYCTDIHLMTPPGLSTFSQAQTQPRFSKTNLTTTPLPPKVNPPIHPSKTRPKTLKSFFRQTTTFSDGICSEFTVFASCLRCLIMLINYKHSLL